MSEFRHTSNRTQQRPQVEEEPQGGFDFDLCRR